jgi:tetratricopeptide (TPR) repeat protein
MIGERIGLYLFRAGQVDEALAIYRASAAQLPGGEPSRERAMLLAAEGHTLMLIGRQREAAVRSREALAVAEAAGASDLEGSILATLGVAAMTDGDIELALSQLRRAQEIGTATGDHELLVRSYVNLSEMLDQIGRTAESADVAREGFAELPGDRFGAPVLCGDAARRLLKLGRYDEADELLGRAVNVGGMAGSAVLEARGLRAMLRGDYAAAEAMLEEAGRLLGNTQGAMWHGAIALARAETALWQGRPDVAVSRLEPALAEVADDDYPFSVAPLFAMGVWAYADLALGGDDSGAARAEALAEALRRRADEPFVPPEV